MQKTNIKRIEKYLSKLPDSAGEQVIAFVSYLNFMKNVDSDYPYPDEKAVIDLYRKAPQKTYSWNDIKDNL